MAHPVVVAQKDSIMAEYAHAMPPSEVPIDLCT